MRGAARSRHVAALERMAVEEARIVLDEHGPRLAPVLAALARQGDRLRSEHARGLHRGRTEAVCAPCHGDPHGETWSTGPTQVPLDLYVAAAEAAAQVLLVFARRIARVEAASDIRSAGAPIIGQDPTLVALEAEREREERPLVLADRAVETVEGGDLL